LLKSGNAVSTGALASLRFWDIDVMVTTHKGRPVAMLKSMDDDSRVKTRLCQYEAYTGVSPDVIDTIKGNIYVRTEL
jgi:CRISPR/Cas system-associated endonuclease Cas1